MSTSGPDDPVDRRAWRRARRIAARTHHPDRGGDVAAYLAALDQVDVAFGVRPRTARQCGDGGAAVVPTIDRWSLLRRSVRRRLRAARRQRHQLQGRLPRRLPGSRRYAYIPSERDHCPSERDH